MRIAVIDYESCDPKVCNFLCRRMCPINRKGDECINVGIRTTGTIKKEYPFINEEMCIGCGICINKCPKKAISVVNTPEQRNDPVHRYGKNEFALFGLPIPVKGVVGLLGANGTGKSTVLNILSGKIVPNLGVVDTNEEEVNSYKELIKREKELTDYFQKLENGEIRSVIKPQQVDMIPKICKGITAHFLKDVDFSIIEKLHIKNCLDRDIDKLSGGELQRVAIAAAISKDADFYFIDEPSSYLDASERLNVAKVIRKLGQEKSVVVVEHDLAVMDFLADRIHILYGKPTVFGIVSKPYSSRKGINSFLEGFISEENVRIRDAITFEAAQSEIKRHEILVQFSDIEKSFENFSMRVEKGEIYRNEVLGIFGANALGKTTFAKILAGEIKSEGNISKQLKISYKPQYINVDNEISVFQLLSSVDNTDFRNQIVAPLNIEKLMDKNVNELSGGELQRVAIALCLGRDADLYLLDEPSAYLDVDQRLAIAKLIKKKTRYATCAIIDHDLMFLNYVSDRAMLFSGISGKQGNAKFFSVKDGFNEFLKSIGVTFRKDPETKRMRANKLDSVKDREQKEKGEYYC